MSFLLDTNVLSAHFRKPAGLTHRFIQHSGRLSTSSVCLGELFVWAYGRLNADEMAVAIDELLANRVTVIDFDREIASVFGQTKRSLLPQGIQIPAVDLMIASTALVHDLTLVTNNLKDFSRIPDLRIVDWLAP